VIRKNGIALLITLLFVIAITVSIGIGLKQVKIASKEVQDENFMLQTSVILDDVLTLLKTSKELDAIVKDSSSEILYIFLMQSAFIPFELGDIKVSLEITSARSRLNVNALVDINGTQSEGTIRRVEAFKTYLNTYGVNLAYADILLDLRGKIKEDMSYNSDIFYEKPYLFRDYIVSEQHLAEVDDFYLKTYHDNNLKNIDTKRLFNFNKNINTAIDVNYATPEVWELIVGVDKLRAQELSFGAGTYTKLEDLEMNFDEQAMMERFKVSYFEPFLDVKIEVIKDDSMAKIHFEYNIKNKKGSNFSYEI